MRRLEKVHAKTFAYRLAGDPRTALASFAIEIRNAAVYRTSDSRCHLVIPPGVNGDVHVVGTPDMGELMPLLADLPLESRVLFPRPSFGGISHMAQRASTRTLEIHAAPRGQVPLRVPPPRPDFDIRQVLYSDVPAWRQLPREAAVTVRGYGDLRTVLSRSVAMGAFNGAHIASLATADLGRSFAIIRAYTVSRLRSKGLATHCVAALIDHLRPTGLRPLFAVEAVNGSPERAMARRFELQKAGELAVVKRKHLAL